MSGITPAFIFAMNNKKSGYRGFRDTPIGLWIVLHVRVDLFLHFGLNFIDARLLQLL